MNTNISTTRVYTVPLSHSVARKNDRLQAILSALTDIDEGRIGGDEIVASLGYSGKSLPSTFAAIALQNVIRSGSQEVWKNKARALLSRLGSDGIDNLGDYLSRMNEYSTMNQSLSAYYAKNRGARASTNLHKFMSVVPNTVKVKGGVSFGLRVAESMVLYAEMTPPSGPPVHNAILKHVVNRHVVQPAVMMYHDSTPFPMPPAQAMALYGRLLGSPLTGVVLEALPFYLAKDLTYSSVVPNPYAMQSLWFSIVHWKEKPKGIVAKWVKLVRPYAIKTRSVSDDGESEPSLVSELRSPSYQPSVGVVRNDFRIRDSVLEMNKTLASAGQVASVIQEMAEVADGHIVGSGEAVGQILRINTVFQMNEWSVQQRSSMTAPQLTQLYADMVEWYYADFLGMDHPDLHPWVSTIKDLPPSSWTDALFDYEEVEFDRASLSQRLLGEVILDEQGAPTDRLKIPVNTIGYNSTNWESGAGFPFGSLTKLEAARMAYEQQDLLWAALGEGESPEALLARHPDLRLIQLKSKTEPYALRNPHSAAQGDDLDTRTGKFIHLNQFMDKVRSIYNVPFIPSDKAQMIASAIDTQYVHAFTPAKGEDGDGNFVPVYPKLERSVIPLKKMNFTGGNCDLLFRRVQRLAPFNGLEGPDVGFLIYSDNVYVFGAIDEATADMFNELNGTSYRAGSRVFISIDGSKMESSSDVEKCHLINHAKLGCAGITATDTPVLYKFAHDLAKYCVAGGYSVFGNLAIHTPYNQSGNWLTFDNNDSSSGFIAHKYMQTRPDAINIRMILDMYKDIGVKMTLERVVPAPPLGQIMLSEGCLDVDLLGYSITVVPQTSGAGPFDDLPYLVVPVLEHARYLKAVTFEKYPDDKVAVSDSKAASKALSLIYAGMWTRDFHFDYLVNVAVKYKMVTLVRGRNVGFDQFVDVPEFSKIQKLLAKARADSKHLPEVREELARRCRALYDYAGMDEVYTESLPPESVSFTTRDGRITDRALEIYANPPPTDRELRSMAKRSTEEYMAAIKALFLKTEPPYDSKLMTIGPGSPQIADVVFGPALLSVLGDIGARFGLKKGEPGNRVVFSVVRKHIAANPSLSTDYPRVLEQLAAHKASRRANVESDRAANKAAKSEAKSARSSAAKAKAESQQYVAPDPNRVRAPVSERTKMVLALQDSSRSTQAVKVADNPLIKPSAEARVAKMRGAQRAQIENAIVARRENRKEYHHQEKADQAFDRKVSILSAPFGRGVASDLSRGPLRKELTASMAVILRTIFLFRPTSAVRHIWVRLVPALATRLCRLNVARLASVSVPSYSEYTAADDQFQTITPLGVDYKNFVIIEEGLFKIAEGLTPIEVTYAQQVLTLAAGIPTAFDKALGLRIIHSMLTPPPPLSVGLNQDGSSDVVAELHDIDHAVNTLPPASKIRRWSQLMVADERKFVESEISFALGEYSERETGVSEGISGGSSTASVDQALQYVASVLLYRLKQLPFLAYSVRHHCMLADVRDARAVGEWGYMVPSSAVLAGSKTFTLGDLHLIAFGLEAE